MSGCPVYVKLVSPLWWDYVLGLRGWGLILYGSLPASLTAMGLVRVEPFQLNGALVLPVAGLAMVPLTLTYLLVKQRLSSWYLFSYGLQFRTAFVTVATVGVSSLISGAAGLVKGRYVWVPPSAWFGTGTSISTPILESLLTGSILLVGSTTLFLTAVKDTGGLPALPSTEFVTRISTLREKLATVVSAGLWTKFGDSGALATELSAALELAVELSQTGFYSELGEDLGALETARDRADGLKGRWDDFFGQGAGPLNEEETRIKSSLTRLRSLRADA